ncbi:MAG TPA: hypothetical protein VGX68_08230 [Thermoanaerobaculia bacterium]|jgi:hypothetical protein|nr:hypothetical protein [Thermoanaerobaculia bacterium]
MPRSVLTTIAVLALSFAPAAGAEKKPSLTLEAIRVEPASPGPDTLCRLSATVRSTGERPVSALQFMVRLNGRDLAAYKDRIYMQPIEPGAARELHLFNFWSTEAGRPAPADGKLTLQVTFAGAAWMQKEVKDSAEIWTAVGPVDGLPVTKSIVLKLKAAP